MSQPYAPGFGEPGYPGTLPASAASLNRPLAWLSLLACAGLTAAPFLAWVTVTQQAFLLVPAQSRSWTALDELPQISNAPGYLALGAGVAGCALALAALATGRRNLAVAGLVPAVTGLAACGLFVQQLQAYSDQLKNDLIARLAAAVLDIKGGLGLGWYLALVCSLLVLLCAAGQLLRRA